MIAVGMMVVVLTQCKSKKEDPGPQQTDAQLQKLVATWNCTAAVKDALPQQGYDGFKLTLSGTPGSGSFGYACAGRPAVSPWPANGTWQFGANTETDILRDTDLAVRYTITDNQLELTFTFTGNGFNSRVAEVGGQWVFTFTK